MALACPHTLWMQHCSRSPSKSSQALQGALSPLLQRAAFLDSRATTWFYHLPKPALLLAHFPWPGLGELIRWPLLAILIPELQCHPSSFSKLLDRFYKSLSISIKEQTCMFFSFWVVLLWGWVFWFTTHNCIARWYSYLIR